MKLERAQEYLTTAVAITVGVVAAYFLGTLSGTGRFGLVIGALAIAGFAALLLALREQVWLLIPFSLQFVGKVEELKGHPTIRDLAVFAVFAGVFVLRAFKVIRRKPSYHAIDFWTGAVLLYLLTVYVRNPVGGEALGSARVGGRPYLDVFTATLAFWVLARVALPAGFARRAFIAVATLSIVSGVLVAVQTLFPSTSPYLARLIGGGEEDMSAFALPEPGEEGGARKFYLTSLGLAITQSFLAAFPPLTLINPVYIVRFLCFCVGVILMLLSGFRSNIFNLAVMFLIATYLRGGAGKVIRLCAVGISTLVLLLLMQGTVIDLPPQVQRSLSFLPGKWDRNVVYDADASSNWRFDMWEQMLKTDRYIESKWFGDGFGMSAMQLQEASSTAAMFSTEQQKENLMTAGIVHSGPVSAIRFVGYVGLVLYLAYLIALSREAWVLCRLCKGTPYYPYSFLIGLPIIYQPFGFLFIFGSYDSELPRTIIGAGMLKMLRTSVELYRTEEVQPESPWPLASLPERPALPAHMQF